MRKTQYVIACLAAVYTVSLTGCGGEEPRRRPRAENEVAAPAGTQVAAAPSGAPAASAPAAPAGNVTGWGTIKGRLVWAGATPDVKNLDVTKDQDYCLKEGPIPDESIVVDPETKGLGNVFVYLVKPKGIHESYPQDKKATAEADAKKFAELNGGLEFTADALSAAVAENKVAVKDLKAPNLMDQIFCRYVPHALAVREGQKILVLNHEAVAHNVKVDGNSGKNNANQNMPPNTFQIFEWQPESGALNIECSIHGWMKMLAMTFDHPYFAVTAKDGSFELKNVPAGANSLVIYQTPKFFNTDGSKGNARGSKVTVDADGVLDLGEVKISE